MIEHKQYDFGSVMHYGKYAFTKNGQPTIEAISNPSQTFGQRNGASDLDIVEINALYNCASKYIILSSFLTITKAWFYL